MWRRRVGASSSEPWVDMKQRREKGGTRPPFSVGDGAWRRSPSLPGSTTVVVGISRYGAFHPVPGSLGRHAALVPSQAAVAAPAVVIGLQVTLHFVESAHPFDPG